VLAPVALIATALVVFLIIARGLDDSGEQAETREQTSAASGCQPDDEQAVEAGYYVLEEGEDLSDVASATCLQVDRLLKLNPGLDPLGLPIGGCVDLVVDGCKALAES
jgi:hypothetical protein